MFNKNVVVMVLSCGLVMVNGVGYSQALGEWYITSRTFAWSLCRANLLILQTRTS